MIDDLKTKNKRNECVSDNRFFISGSLGIFAYLFSLSVFANPVLDNIAHGNVNIQQNNNSTVVNQTSQKAIINWQSFNIGSNESTHFQQPADGVALNRINPSQGVSKIYGRLTATGRIILVNPAGIYFGPGSYVNVGGLIASTANITDQNFLNDYYHFSSTTSHRGSVVNKGMIIAADHGLVALIGGAVSNEGHISANVGQVTLASGDAFTMSFSGNDLIGFTIDQAAPLNVFDENGNSVKSGIKNTGTIRANDGNILISAKTAAGVLDHVINLDGIIEAKSVYKSKGTIVISGNKKSGVVRISGKISASGKKGGNINITGHNILLDSSAEISASGDFGGGNINIGGNYQGKGTLPNANAVIMAPGAKIVADALMSGDGGNVVLWSDYYTNVNGLISARGGSLSGNGGSVETSGKQILNVGDLAVDVSAPYGATGTWLLDPYNITVSSSATSNGTFNGGNPNIFTPSGTANIQASTINTNLATANVFITTGGAGSAGADAGDITIDGTAVINWSNSNLLTFSAYRNISNAGSITSTGGGRLTLLANNSGAFTVGSGSGTVTNTGTLNINGAVNVYYNPTDYTTPVTYTNSGAGAVTAYMYVNNVTELQNLGSNLSGNYALSTNIDARATTSWNAGAGFAPIGSFSTGFTGRLDGLNYTISDLFIYRPTTNYVGLIASNSGTITNLGLINLNITGQGQVGGFAGYNQSGTITNSYVSNGTVTGNNSVGGIVGNIFFGTIVNDYNHNTSVIGVGNSITYIGGLIGQFYGARITDSYNTGNVTILGGGSNVGGLVGGGGLSVIPGPNSFDNLYNTGNVTVLAAGSNVGGLVGWLIGVDNVTNAYNSGNINVGAGSTAIGGFIGSHYNNSTSSTNVYNVGSVTAGTGSSQIGGLMGYNAGNIIYAYSTGLVTAPGSADVGGLIGIQFSQPVSTSNSFWDTTTSNMSVGIGSLVTGTFTATPGCFTGTGCLAGTANLSSLATYAGNGFTITSTVSTTSTKPGGTWFIFEGQTRPMLLFEFSNNIVTPHQVQLMGTTLGASYTLRNNIDFSGAMNSAADVWNTNRSLNAGTGFIPIGNTTNNFTGSLNGQGYAINNLYINQTTGGNIGLFGVTNNAVIQNIGVANAAFTQSGSASGGGIIVGAMNGSSSLTNVYASGSINNIGNTGSLVGEMIDTSSVTDAYNVAAVTSTGSGASGGIVGAMLSGTPTILRVYNSGAVASGNPAGGIVGTLISGTVSNSLFDSNTSLVSTGTGTGSSAGITAGCFTGVGCVAGTANLSALATYSGLGWDITSTPSLTGASPANTWFIFAGNTRPMLMMENTESISNEHQLQMMGAALDGNYAIDTNIYAANAFNNLSEVWHTRSSTTSGTGFIAIGNNTNNYTNQFNGNYFFVDGLYMNAANNTNVGLFGVTSTQAYIRNTGVTNANITANNTLSDGSVGAGILVGTSNGIVFNSYSTGNITAGANNYYSGALIGINSLTGSVTNSYSEAILTSGITNNYLGGLVGGNAGAISTSYSVGKVVAGDGSSYVGGVAGTTSGTMTDSFSLTVVMANNSDQVGGLAGQVTAGVQNNLYSAGAVVASGSTNVGGLIGSVAGGSVTNSFWDTQTSAQSSSAAGTGRTTAQMMTSSTFSGAGWDMTNTWNILASTSYPYLRAFTTVTPRIISGTSPGVIGTSMNLAVAGTNKDTVFSQNNGAFYFFEAFNNISRVDRRIADSTPALVYLSSGSIVSNNVVIVPASTGSLSGATALSLTNDTVTAGNAGTSGALSNSLLSTAKGSLSGGYILYAVDGSNNLSLTSGKSFLTTATTAYTINGNVAATSGNITFNGAVTISSTNPVISTTTGGNILFGSTVSGGGNALTVSNPVGATATFSGVISGSGTALTKLGAGDLTLSSASNSFTGGLFLHGGTFTTASLPGAAGNSVIGTGNLSIDNAASLVYTGSSVVFNRAITVASGGGTIQTTNASANTLTVSGGITNNGALIFDASGAGPTNITVSTSGISGAGSISKTGTGTLTLNTANTYSGATSVLNGTLIVNNINALGTTAGATSVASGASLDINGVNIGAEAVTISGAGFGGAGALIGSGTSSLAGAVTLAGNGTISTNGSFTLSGNIGESSVSTLTKAGAGTLIFTGSNNYSDTSIGAGTLQVGTGGTSGTLGSGNIVNNAILVLNRSDSTSINGVISGSGNLTQAGSGLLTLTGNNTYSGVTTISAGSLQIGAGGTSGTIGSGNIVNNAALLFNRSDTLLVGAVISGSGTVSQNGGGVLTLTGNNTYIGGTTLNAGTLNAGHNNAFGTGTITMNTGTLMQNVSGINLPNDILLGGDSSIDNNAGIFTLSGQIDGGFALTLSGSGSTVLNDAVGAVTPLGSVTASSALSVAGGGIATTGSQTYANTVLLVNDAVFDASGTGTHSIAFNSNILGGNNLTLSGSGTGTYNYTINSLVTNNVIVTSAPGSTNSSLTLNSGGTQLFNLTGTNLGNVTSIATVAGTFNFNNIHNLIGGSNSTSTLKGENIDNTWNIVSLNGGNMSSLGGGFVNMYNLTGGTGVDVFNFTPGGSIAGLVTGGDTVNNNQINFTTFPGNISLLFNSPTGDVLNSGVVQDRNRQTIVTFDQMLLSNGNNIGRIYLPESYRAIAKITYYDSTKLNGEIADPFIFYGWIIANPFIIPSIAPIINPAPINLQPIINAENNLYYVPEETVTGRGCISYHDEVSIKPLVNALNSAGTVAIQSWENKKCIIYDNKTSTAPLREDRGQVHIQGISLMMN